MIKEHELHDEFEVQSGDWQGLYDLVRFAHELVRHVDHLAGTYSHRLLTPLEVVDG